MRLALIFAVLASPAFGQEFPCGPRATMVTMLIDQYGEAAQGIGLIGAAGVVMEVFASPETGTWTIAFTDANGKMCLIAAGDNYERIDGAVRPNL